MSPTAKRLAALLMALPLAATAAPAKKNAPAEALRPTGPVTVTADRAEWAKNGVMVYTGNVRLNSDTLKLSGDRVELTQLPDSQYTAKITGKPAHLEHTGETNDKGEPTPPIGADASTLLYDSRSAIVDLIGDAHMTRGKDEVNGNSIRYNVAERRIQASGGSGGQVKIVIQPPPDKKAPKTAPPDASSAATPAPEAQP